MLERWPAFGFAADDVNGPAGAPLTGLAGSVRFTAVRSGGLKGSPDLAFKGRLTDTRKLVQHRNRQEARWDS